MPARHRARTTPTALAVRDRTLRYDTTAGRHCAGEDCTHAAPALSAPAAMLMVPPTPRSPR